MNKFVIIAPTFNAEKTCRQALLSLAAQSYSNWQLIVIDDMSTDDTNRKILQLSDKLGFLAGDNPKVKMIFNKEKKWEIENTLQGLSLCQDDDIICRLDMDDFLTDNNALQIINSFYSQTPTLDVLWTAHRWFDDEKLTPMNISANMVKGSDPYVHPWVSSHFKTFRKKVLNDVKDENYRGADGKYFKRIGDQAFMLPALKNARDWGFLQLVTYAYRCSQEPETFQTDDAKFQASESQFLRSRGYIK